MVETIQIQGSIVLGLALFSLGALGFFWKRDAISMFVCVEMMLNAANLVILAFASQLKDPLGVGLVVFIIAVAAAEAGVGLAIFICGYNTHAHLRVDDYDELKQ